MCHLFQRWHCRCLSQVHVPSHTPRQSPFRLWTEDRLRTVARVGVPSAWRAWSRSETVKWMEASSPLKTTRNAADVKTSPYILRRNGADRSNGRDASKIGCEHQFSDGSRDAWTRQRRCRTSLLVAAELKRQRPVGGPFSVHIPVPLLRPGVCLLVQDCSGTRVLFITPDCVFKDWWNSGLSRTFEFIVKKTSLDPLTVIASPVDQYWPISADARHRIHRRLGDSSRRNLIIDWSVFITLNWHLIWNWL